MNFRGIITFLAFMVMGLVPATVALDGAGVAAIDNANAPVNRGLVDHGVTAAVYETVTVTAFSTVTVSNCGTLSGTPTPVLVPGSSVPVTTEQVNTAPAPAPSSAGTAPYSAPVVTPSSVPAVTSATTPTAIESSFSSVESSISSVTSSIVSESTTHSSATTTTTAASKTTPASTSAPPASSAGVSVGMKLGYLLFGSTLGGAIALVMV